MLEGSVLEGSVLEVCVVINCVSEVCMIEAWVLDGSTSEDGVVRSRMLEICVACVLFISVLENCAVAGLELVKLKGSVVETLLLVTLERFVPGG